MKKTFFIVPILAILFFACDTSKTATTSTVSKTAPKVMAPVSVVKDTTPATTEAANTSDDALAITKENSDSVPVYRAVPTLTNDILHTKLDVKFDYTNQHLLGKAWITAKPYFYATQSMELDAKGFDINEVTFENSKTPLKYTYDGKKLIIDLGRKFTRDEKYTVYIDYVAKPNETPVGGSAAITSDKGLFFINPDGKDGDKPRQVWTQGETESNSKWFPTFDKPNERMTSEIYMTVENQFKTLSNGLLKDSKKNTDGTRTDHWVMDLPSAPYLVMMAVGDFVIEKEMWNGKEILYYVEPKYAGKGKILFKNVAELLTFYSDRLGVPFPWQKLAHIAVRDYVSGAMENTSAILYGEFMNGDERELAERDYNETVVAHEMFHQWFGDYVTCESWSNLTVNESFADFSEGLWLEHKYGMETGDAHRKEVVDGYLGQARGTIHPLVDFKYEDKEAMFDGHSYNKGGTILHMLRHYLGDEAFFAGLKKYLTDNAFKTGEAHQLRLAFEAVTGQDLNWFFNQWYYRAGHPILDIAYNYDATTKKITATVTQKQGRNIEEPKVFQLPIDFDIYTEGSSTPTRQTLMMTKRTQTFVFDAPTANTVVDFDGDRVLLAEKTDKHSDTDWRTIYKNSKRFLARKEALDVIYNLTDADSKKVMLDALNDHYWSLREFALENLGTPYNDATLATLEKMAKQDEKPDVRLKAIEKLGKTKDKRFVPILENAMENDKSYRVNSAALKALNRIDSSAALQTAKKLENSTNVDILEGVSELYSKTPSVANLAFFENNFSKIDGQNAVSFASNYAKLLSKSVGYNDIILPKLTKLKDLAIKDASPWRRLAYTRAIAEVRKDYKIVATTQYSDLTKLIGEITQVETNEQLKNFFLQLMTGK